MNGYDEEETYIRNVKCPVCGGVCHVYNGKALLCDDCYAELKDLKEIKERMENDLWKSMSGYISYK